MSNLTFRKENSKNISDHRYSITIKDSSDKSQEIRASTLQWCPKRNYLLFPEWNPFLLREIPGRSPGMEGGTSEKTYSKYLKTPLCTLATCFTVVACGEVEAGPATGHRAWQCLHPQNQESQQNKICQRIRAAPWITLGNTFPPRSHWRSVSKRPLVQKEFVQRKRDRHIHRHFFFFAGLWHLTVFWKKLRFSPFI